MAHGGDGAAAEFGSLFFIQVICSLAMDGTAGCALEAVVGSGTVPLSKSLDVPAVCMLWRQTAATGISSLPAITPGCCNGHGEVPQMGH